MELLEGKTLAERVETEGPLSIDSVRALASQLLDALAAVHRAQACSTAISSRPTSFSCPFAAQSS
jgi:hypothetical protein